MTRIRSGGTPCRSSINPAMKREAAITTSPFAITALYWRFSGRFSP